MKLYQNIDRIPFLRKSYVLKFLFIAFLGIHIPLLGMLWYIIFRETPLSPLALFLSLLILTLVATGFTLWLLFGLLSPILKSYQAILKFSEDHQSAIQLPDHFEDEAGRLMHSLNRLSKEVADSDQEKDDVISLLSHDMRSPSSAVAMLANLLKEDEENEEKREHLNAIAELAEGQLNMLEGILSLLKASQNSVQCAQLELPEMVLLAIERTRNHLDSKGIELDLKLTNALVYSNLEIALNALVNVISNAIKFTHRKGRIEIECIDSVDTIQVKVSDDGVGFKQQNKESIFNRFSAESSKGTEGEKSTGLGLFLSRRFLRMIQSDIYAESEGPGKGSTFTIELPKA